MFDDGVGMDQIETAITKKAGVGRAGMHEREKRLVGDLLEFGIHDREVEPVPVLADELLADEPIRFGTAEIEDLALAAFPEDVLDQALDRPEALSR